MSSSLPATPSRAAVPLRRFRSLGAVLIALCSTALSLGAVAQQSTFTQTNIISSGAVPAAKTDPNLINPWGVSIGKAFWIDSPGSGLSLVDDASGNNQFDVAVPPAASTSPHGSPAGTIFNGDPTLFKIPGDTSALFLFGNLDGSIAAWNASTPQAVTVINNSAAHAAYTDIAVAKNSSGSFLLAANFASGNIDIFDSRFAPAQLTGSFTDPQLPAGFSPFAVHTIGTTVFVTYAQLNTVSGREVVGAGLGYVDAYDLNGSFLQRAISQGNLNAPWGMALAPAGFGTFAGDLLVGNFGDGVINAYDPKTYALVGQIADATGKIIANPGLWEILFGSNGVGDPGTLYFAAGINNGKDGLFGSLTPAAPAAGAPDFALTSSSTALTITGGQSGTATLSLTGANGFSGPVTFSCTGLPAGDSCTFTPPTVTLSGNAATNVSVTIATIPAATGTGGSVGPYTNGSLNLPGESRGVVFAFVGPFGILAFVGFRRRTSAVRGGFLLLAVAVVSLGVVGCSSSNPSQTATPAAPKAPVTSQVNISATSGPVTRSIVMAITVQ